MFPWEGGGLFLNNRLVRMCYWVGWYFVDWIDYHGVSFPTESLEWGHTFSEMFGVIDHNGKKVLPCTYSAKIDPSIPP